MVQHLIVPVDGSQESWQAFDVAVAIASRVGADVQVVEVYFDPADVGLAAQRLDDQLRRHDSRGVDVLTEVRLGEDSVASELESLLLDRPGAVLVMSSRGKGRSAAFLGSVSDDVLQRTFGPVIMVGPKVEVDDFSGPVVVTVDGSDESEAALPLAAAWAIELRTTPWVVSAGSPSTTETADRLRQGDVVDTGYLSRLAQSLRSFSKHDVEFDELHDDHPGTAIPEYATSRGASLIVASSHGRTGLSRLTVGSVTASFVRHATCPVVIVRLPRPAHAAPPHTGAAEGDRMWSY